MPFRSPSRRGARTAVLTAATLIGTLGGIAATQTGSTAATLTSGGFTTHANVPATAVVAGNAAALTAVVKSTAASTVLVDLEVYGPAGAKVFQRSWDKQTFTAGQQRWLSASWTTPTTASGTYKVKIGVFAAGWGPLKHWNDNAGSFSVVKAGTTTTTTKPTTTTAAPATTTTVLPTTTTTAPAGGTLPALPAGWPSAFELGSADSPGGAAALRGMAPFGFRYQYLSGGANTGNGWATWNPNGDFATYYIQESRAAGVVPVFTYYQIFQSTPGVSQGEPAGIYSNLGNGVTMSSYFNDLKLFFQRAGAQGGLTVLHVEPDLWGYLQQKAMNDDATTVPVKVAASGQTDMAGLADNAAGFAQGIVRLRDRYAPNVVLGYHFSTWGTGTDIIYSDPTDAAVDALGVRTGRFEQSLAARFDIAFTDLADRDAAFKQYVYGDNGAAWYTADDYRRSTVYIGAFGRTAKLRSVLWQVPLGNTKMRAENNTWNHYQDNKVEWLLDDAGRSHLTAYENAGVVAVLYGRGADGPTCACDANGDGVTNPAAINGNTRSSINADDDGGYFKERAAAYYAAGRAALPN